jgi:hypothetical protein
MIFQCMGLFCRIVFSDPVRAMFHAVGFKKCCLKSGRYDGMLRNHYFPRLTPSS